MRTRYSWISNGTKGSLLRGERIQGETPYTPGATWPFPIAAGYQSTGIVEAVGDNPSFRPRFRLFHWVTAGGGALGCVVVSVVISLSPNGAVDCILQSA